MVITEYSLKHLFLDQCKLGLLITAGPLHLKKMAPSEKVLDLHPVSQHQFKTSDT